MRMYFWLLSLLVFGILPLQAQQENCDSTFRALLAEEKIEQAITLSEQCWQHYQTKEDGNAALAWVNTNLEELLIRAASADIEKWIARGDKLLQTARVEEQALREHFLFKKAEIRLESGQLDVAMELFEELEVSLEIGTTQKYPEIWLNLQRRKAELLRRKGELELARALLNKALNKIEQGEVENSNLQENKAMLLNERGINYRNQGQLDKAQYDLLASLDLLDELYKDQTNAVFAPVFNNLGIIYARLGLPDKALEYFKLTAAVDEATYGPNNRYIPGTYNNIANIYLDLNQLHEAELAIAKSFEVAQQFLPPNHPNMIIYYSTLVALSEDMGRPERKLEYARKKFAISRKLRDKEPLRYGEGLADIGSALLSIGQNDSAAYYHQLWWDFTLQQYGKASIQAADVAWRFGETLISSGKDAQRGLRLMEQSAKILESYPENYFERWRCYSTLAKYYRQADRYRESWEAGQKYLAHLLPNYQNQAPQSCFQAPNETPFSQREYLFALGLNMQNLYEWGLASDSLVYLKAAYCYAEELVSQMLQLRISFEASSNQQQLLATKTEEIYTAISICWELAQRLEEPAYLKQAFQLAELNKGLGLLDATRQKDVAKATGLPDSLRIAEAQLRMELAGLQKEATDARMAGKTGLEQSTLANMLPLQERVKAFQAFLSEKYPNYYQKQYSSTLVDVDLLQQELLDERTALVEYFLGEKALYRFYLTKEDLQVSRLPLPTDFESSFDELRQSLSNIERINDKGAGALANYPQLAHRYYRLLLEEPLEQQSRERLIVVTDGILGHLPFEALLTKPTEPNSRALAEFPYLLKSHTLSYAYSAQLLLERLKQPLHPNRNLLALAANYEAGVDSLGQRSPKQRSLRNILSDLPGAREEVKALAARYEGRFLLGDAATERNFREQKGPFGVIHLAMHGVMDAENPMASSLVFTETADSLHDNFLYAYELSNLSIPANLAVLSACETGYGKFQKGEGVLSIARAFRYAGVPSLVMSLWQVNDAATEKVMGFLYESLAEGLEKDEALRQAKLRYLETAKGQAAHPFYWAGWSMLGDARPVALKEKGGFNWGYLGIGLALVVLIALLWWRRKPR